MKGIENKPLRYLLQAINYTVFMALIWYFASAPSIRLLEHDEAMITIAFAHAGDLRQPCHKLSSEELANLAPNMRKLEDCPRARSPVIIEALLDGETLYSKTLLPSGLYSDGGVDVYFSGKVTAGSHRFEIAMNDSVRQQGFNHSFNQQITISPAQIVLIDFDTEKGFVVK
jgi:hypothetical protein